MKQSRGNLAAGKKSPLLGKSSCLWAHFGPGLSCAHRKKMINCQPQPNQQVGLWRHIQAPGRSQGLAYSALV